MNRAIERTVLLAAITVALLPAFPTACAENCDFKGWYVEAKPASGETHLNVLFDPRSFPQADTRFIAQLNVASLGPATFELALYRHVAFDGNGLIQDSGTAQFVRANAPSAMQNGQRLLLNVKVCENSYPKPVLIRWDRDSHGHKTIFIEPQP
ncbi:MAG: hypothetical protein ABSE86_03115 [Bryobacteraceae bacterium]|jgi:hypothetical protein